MTPSRSSRVVYDSRISLASKEKESGVNGARTRIIAWGRKTYVGEDPKGSARKRTD